MKAADPTSEAPRRRLQIEGGNALEAMNVKFLPPSCRGMSREERQAAYAALAVEGSAVADGTLRGCGVAASSTDAAVADTRGSGESFEWDPPWDVRGIT